MQFCIRSSNQLVLCFHRGWLTYLCHKQCCRHVFACTYLALSHLPSQYMHSTDEHPNCTFCVLFLSTQQAGHCIARHMYPMPGMHTLLKLLIKPTVQLQRSMSMHDRPWLICSASVCCCGLDTLWNVHRDSICGDHIHHPLLCI